MTTVPPVLLLVTLFATPVGAATLRVPGDLPLQAALNASAAGDTVLVAPGTYPKAVTVDVDVLVQPDPALAGPTPVLAGVTGSAATFRGFSFDGSLEAGRGTVIEAGDDLVVDGCALANGVIGVSVSGSCTFSGSLDNFLTGLSVSPDATLTATVVITGCETGLYATAPKVPAGGGRSPHPSCPDAGIELVDSRITGGRTAVDTDGFVSVLLRRTVVEGTVDGLLFDDGCLLLEDTEISGTGTDTGTGVDLVASYAGIARSTVTGFGIGIRATDDARPVYTAGVLGGSLADGNVLGGNGVNLSLEQPEWIDADNNWWGTTDCEALGIEGMTPARIAANADRTLGILCTVPTETVTWGALKTRFGGAR